MEKTEFKSATCTISGSDHENDAIIKLKHLEKVDCSVHINLIEEMSIKAQKQFKIEMDIRKIKKNLKENELVIEKYKVSTEGVQFYMLKEIDNVMQDLDDKIQNLQAMKN